MVTQLGENESAKSGIIIIPNAAKEQPKENELLDIGGVQAEKEQRVPLNAKVGDRILLGIQIDDEGYLIIRKEKYFATLSGIANAASGNKQVPQCEGVPANNKIAGTQDEVFHWQDKL
jgi:co-chaperonin GroES (HSP10)